MKMSAILRALFFFRCKKPPQSSRITWISSASCWKSVLLIDDTFTACNHTWLKAAPSSLNFFLLCCLTATSAADENGPRSGIFLINSMRIDLFLRK
jgi:hypothetical protein